MTPQPRRPAPVPRCCGGVLTPPTREGSRLRCPTSKRDVDEDRSVRSFFACYLRSDHGDLGAWLQRPVGGLDALKCGGGPREVALEPGRRADEQIARVRVAVVGECMGDVARSERKLARAPGEPLTRDLEDQLAVEHVEGLVEVVRVQGWSGAA